MISTWSPHFYRSACLSADKSTSMELDHLFIGPPGVEESNANVVINLALTPDNYEPDVFERLDDAEQAKQLCAVKALIGRSELPVQMDEFPMFSFTIN